MRSQPGFPGCACMFLFLFGFKGLGVLDKGHALCFPRSFES